MTDNNFERSRLEFLLIGGLAIFLLGMVCISIIPATAQDQSGDLNVSTDSVTTEPESNTTVRATLRNEGNRSLAQIEVFFTKVPAGWNVSDSTIKRLPSNETETIPLHVTVPQNATSGEYHLTVRAETKENISDESQTTIVISEGPPETSTGSSNRDASTPTETADGGVGGPVGKPCRTIPFTDICMPSIQNIIDKLWPF